MKLTLSGTWQDIPTQMQTTLAATQPSICYDEIAEYEMLQKLTRDTRLTFGKDQSDIAKGQRYQPGRATRWHCANCGEYLPSVSCIMGGVKFFCDKKCKDEFYEEKPVECPRIDNLCSQKEILPSTPSKPSHEAILAYIRDYLRDPDRDYSDLVFSLRVCKGIDMSLVDLVSYLEELYGEELA